MLTERGTVSEQSGDDSPRVYPTKSLSRGDRPAERTLKPVINQLSELKFGAYGGNQCFWLLGKISGFADDG